MINDSTTRFEEQQFIEFIEEDRRWLMNGA
jgi:hypothetical protein